MDEGIFKKPIKVVVVGDGAVGKTCMLISFTQNCFPDEYTPTVFDNHTINVEHDDIEYKLNLWDTAGQADFDDVRTLGYVDTDVFLICFSFDDKDSFENIQHKWAVELNKFFQKSGKVVPLMIVGCKSDLKGDEENGGYDLSEKDIQKTKTTVKAWKYFECSAKSQKGVKEVFLGALQVVLENKKKGNSGGNGGKSCTIL